LPSGIALSGAWEKGGCWLISPEEKRRGNATLTRIFVRIPYIRGRKKFFILFDFTRFWPGKISIKN
jgi:hypothetical protein